MSYQMPFRGKYKLGTPYGKKGTFWKAGWHSGLDIFSKREGGDGKVYPISKGIVQRVTKGDSYGNSVRVLHPDGYISLYAHFASVFVKVGQEVGLDTVLGLEGSTGNSTAVHLHLEIHEGEYAYPASINPETFLAEKMKEVDMDIKDTTVKVGSLPISGKLIDGVTYVPLRDMVEAIKTSLAVTWSKEDGAGVDIK